MNFFIEIKQLTSELETCRDRAEALARAKASAEARLKDATVRYYEETVDLQQKLAASEAQVLEYSTRWSTLKARVALPPSDEALRDLAAAQVRETTLQAELRVLREFQDSILHPAPHEEGRGLPVFTPSPARGGYGSPTAESPAPVVAGSAMFSPEGSMDSMATVERTPVPLVGVSVDDQLGTGASRDTTMRPPAIRAHRREAAETSADVSSSAPPGPTLVTLPSSPTRVDQRPSHYGPTVASERSRDSRDAFPAPDPRDMLPPTVLPLGRSVDVSKTVPEALRKTMLKSLDEKALREFREVFQYHINHGEIGQRLFRMNSLH